VATLIQHERSPDVAAQNARLFTPLDATWFWPLSQPVRELVWGTMTTGAYLWHLVEPILAMRACASSTSRL